MDDHDRPVRVGCGVFKNSYHYAPFFKQLHPYFEIVISGLILLMSPNFFQGYCSMEIGQLPIFFQTLQIPR